jgi:hypothetical protein
MVIVYFRQFFAFAPPKTNKPQKSIKSDKVGIVHKIKAKTKLKVGHAVVFAGVLASMWEVRTYTSRRDVEP